MYAAPARRVRPAIRAGLAGGYVGAGAWEVPGELAESLRRDVDDVADLHQAQALGVGVHTAELAEGPGETQ